MPPVVEADGHAPEPRGKTPEKAAPPSRPAVTQAAGRNETKHEKWCRDVHRAARTAYLRWRLQTGVKPQSGAQGPSLPDGAGEPVDFRAAKSPFVGAGLQPQSLTQGQRRLTGLLVAFLQTLSRGEAERATALADTGQIVQLLAAAAIHPDRLERTIWSAEHRLVLELLRRPGSGSHKYSPYSGLFAGGGPGLHLRILKRLVLCLRAQGRAPGEHSGRPSPPGREPPAQQTGPTSAAGQKRAAANRKLASCLEGVCHGSLRRLKTLGAVLQGGAGPDAVFATAATVASHRMAVLASEALLFFADEVLGRGHASPDRRSHSVWGWAANPCCGQALSAAVVRIEQLADLLRAESAILAGQREEAGSVRHALAEQDSLPAAREHAARTVSEGLQTIAAAVGAAADGGAGVGHCAMCLGLDLNQKRNASSLAKADGLKGGRGRPRASSACAQAPDGRREGRRQAPPEKSASRGPDGSCIEWEQACRDLLPERGGGPPGAHQTLVRKALKTSRVCSKTVRVALSAMVRLCDHEELAQAEGDALSTAAPARDRSEPARCPPRPRTCLSPAPRTAEGAHDRLDPVGEGVALSEELEALAGSLERAAAERFRSSSAAVSRGRTYPRAAGGASPHGQKPGSSAAAKEAADAGPLAEKEGPFFAAGGLGSIPSPSCVRAPNSDPARTPETASPDTRRKRSPRGKAETPSRGPTKNVARRSEKTKRTDPGDEDAAAVGPVRRRARKRSSRDARQIQAGPKPKSNGARPAAAHLLFRKTVPT